VSTIDFITELFCRVDDAMRDVPRHSQANLYPGEIVTLALLFVLKGVGNRAFYRWVKRDLKPLFPGLPERTRLFRLFNTHRDWARRFLAEPSLLGLADSYGIELIHPRREGRSPRQIGRKGQSNWRWIVGVKLAFVLNHLGLIVDWDCDTANVYDGSAFQDLIERVVKAMIIFCDEGFSKKDWHPDNLRVCVRGEWNSRILQETVLSMLTTVCHLKKLSHRVWDYLETHLAYIMALFNILVQWHGLQPDESGFVRLSIAEFSL
jgi:hypothetical protein